MGRLLRALAGVAMVLAVTAGVAGCTGDSKEGSASPDKAAESPADSLWSARTPHLGDNSAVLALLREVRDSDGEYTVGLQTDAPPYVLTIEEQDSQEAPSGPTAVRRAILMLGLVENLDEVVITSAGKRYTVTSDAATDRLGYDVKELGRDRDRLAAYLTESDG